MADTDLHLDFDPDRWHIITPFRVIHFGRFIRAAQAAGFWQVFKRNSEGYAFCVDPRREQDRPSLEKAYALIQEHVPPGEYALFRIEATGLGELGDEDHTRYEKVYRDRIEPCAYNDDPMRHQR